MIWLLKFIFFGHAHNWKVLRATELNGMRNGKITERGTRYVLQCEKCGDVKKRDLI